MPNLLFRNSSSNKKTNTSTNDKVENYEFELNTLSKLTNTPTTTCYYLIFYLLTLLLTYQLVNTSLNLKTLHPLSNELQQSNEFNSNRAQLHLNTISSLPHGFNNLNNSRVFEYLLDQVKLLEKEGNGRLEWVIDNDKELIIPQHQKGLDNWLGSFGTYFPSSNLVVRVKGNKSTGKALLLSAHYDSRPLSPGATDAGVGVSVSLEILKILINNPPQGFDLIINFNNAEETFLLGARSFKFNKWFKDVHYFINLEGSGAGGKSLLFQSSNYALTKAMITGSQHHVNPIGNDLFNFRLLPSATDYQIYTKQLNLTGIDLAMYRNRALYHTLRDNFEHAPIETTKFMGEFTLQGIRNLRGVEDNNGTTNKIIYFDVLNLGSIIWEFTTIYRLIGLFYILEILLIILYYLKFNNYNILSLNLKSITKGLLTTVGGLILNFIIGGVLINQLIMFNPMVVHTYPRFCLLIFLAVSIWSQLFANSIWFKLDIESRSSLEFFSWLGTLLLFNILVVIQLITHWFGFVSLFFLLIQSYSILSSFLIYFYYNQFLIYPKSPKLHTNNQNNKINPQPYISLVVNYLPSSIIIMGIGLPLLLAGHQGPPTGASPYLPYLICLLTTSFSSLLTGPTLIPLINIKRIKLVLGGIIAAVYFISLLLFPYSIDSPLPIDYNQIVQLNKDFKPIDAFIQLRISSKTDKLVNFAGIEPIEVLRGIKGGRSSFDLIKINSEVPELPNYEGYGVKLLNSTNLGESQEITLGFNMPESKICYLQFLQPIDNLMISHLNSNYISMIDPTSSSSLTDQIRLFRNNPGLGWKLKFYRGINKVGEDKEEFIINSKCYLERWNQVNELVNKLPKWVTLTNQNLGIVEIQTKFNIKL